MSQSFDKMSWGRIVDTSLCRKKWHYSCFQNNRKYIFQENGKIFSNSSAGSSSLIQVMVSISFSSEFATKGNLISKPAWNLNIVNVYFLQKFEMIIFWNSILMAKIMRRKNLKNKILVEKYKRYHFIQTPLSCWFIFKIQKDT